MRKVVLNPSDKEKLSELQRYSTNLVERERSLILLLSHQGHSMSKVAKLANVGYSTVIRLLDAWEGADPKDRFSVLRYAPGQGAKVKLAPIVDQVPLLMDEHSGNLNLVLYSIEKQHGIKVCKLTLQNFLKGTGICL